MRSGCCSPLYLPLLLGFLIYYAKKIKPNNIVRFNIVRSKDVVTLCFVIKPFDVILTTLSAIRPDEDCVTVKMTKHDLVQPFRNMQLESREL